MDTITISHYTRGQYLGTDDKTVAWSVLYNGGVPLTAEVSEDIARNYAAQQFAKLRHGRLTEWNGDSLTEYTLEEK